MVAVNTRGGLSTRDLQSIRDNLAAGRKPKVVFTEAAGQIVGQVGQIIALTDPSVSDEWIVVRFGRDELPFSPGDLAIPARAVRVAAPPVGPRPEPPVQQNPPPTHELTVPAPTPTRVPSPTPSAARDIPPPRQEAPMSAPADTDSPADGGNGKPAKKAPPKAAKPKPAPSLTITVAFTEGEWTVAAQQGAKALARPYIIKPTEALKIVGTMDVPGIHEAVDQIVESQRAEAEHHATRLRAELAEIEAKLTELRNGR
jgi:hypothetical protein